MSLIEKLRELTGQRTDIIPKKVLEKRLEEEKREKLERAKMSMQERIERIKSERGRGLEEERRRREEEDLELQNSLKDLAKFLEIFGINKALSEVNQEIMDGQGEMKQFSGIQERVVTFTDEGGGYAGERHYIYAEANTALEWNKAGNCYEIGARVTDNREYGEARNYIRILLSYPEGEDYHHTASLKVDNLGDDQHPVDGDMFVYERKKTLSTVEISGVCQDKIASICIHLQEQGLL